MIRFDLYFDCNFKTNYSVFIIILWDRNEELYVNNLIYNILCKTEMIELISKLEVSINQRFDHISMLTIDSEEMTNFIKDDEKKRNMVRNFRLIKSAEKQRIAEQARIISLISKLSRKLTKHQIIVCESMITSCINQYLNTEYVIHKSGQPNDLISVFTFYYEKIKAHAKVRQMTVIKNMNLLHELNFMGENLQFFLSNMQESMKCLYEGQKNKFFQLLKQENRSISPEKKNNEQEEEQRFDFTGNIKGKKKRQLQLYCFQLSKLLNLQHVYIDYFYFSSMDVEKRKKMLQGNYLKRNVFIKRLIQNYQKDYGAYRAKQQKQSKKKSANRQESNQITNK